MAEQEDDPELIQAVWCCCLFLPVLETVKAAQLQNGLRHRDFQRYRQYCSRRLQRVRKSVKFTHGKGKTYIGKKVDAETATEARFLYIPLYNAERAWSYAMQLKEVRGGLWFSGIGWQ